MTGVLTGRRAVVTGAGQGLGRAIAERFAAAGAEVIVAERNPSTGKEVAKAITQAGGTARWVATDVSDSDSAARLAEEANDTSGFAEILVNNAGIGGVRSLEETDDALWHSMIDINLGGVFLVSKSLLPAMLERGRGSIVNVSSIYGTVGGRNIAAYAASKGGVLMLTRTMAVDYASMGVRVNAICPGYVDGPMARREYSSKELEQIAAQHPIGRLARPDEIARATLFLASDDASFVTGSCLLADGGYVAA